MTTKTCSKCGVAKPIAEFYKDAKNRDGLQSRCKECVDTRIERWRKANLARVAANRRQYYANNPEQYEKHKAHMRAYMRRRYYANKAKAQ
jgi:hypothetical protein